MSSKPYFDNVAQQWDSMRTEFFSDVVRERALDVAGVKPGDLAADIGAGSGFITEALIAVGCRVIAVDQSPAMLDVMRNKFGEAPVEYRVGTTEALPIDPASVDYALANMVLHHIERPPDAIRALATVLKPGGKLVITDLDAHEFEFLRNEQHDRWLGFDRSDVQQWFEAAKLVDVRVEDVGSSCCADSDCGSQRADVSIFVAIGTRIG